MTWELGVLLMLLFIELAIIIVGIFMLKMLQKINQNIIFYGEENIQRSIHG